jgi:2-C-methyl-D-erythritol 4-phosphate cytidylyltransferase/2-C-methyl-D-erythritol 2,4-cyclodiphosphate synthase
VAHAVVDALLSAAGLGDIGSNFGTDRNEYAGASGERFISETLSLLAKAGFVPANVSVQIIAEKPKISPRRLELEHHLSEVVGAPVSVLATTTDGLGFLADSRGIAAVATALVRTQS